MLNTSALSSKAKIAVGLALAAAAGIVLSIVADIMEIGVINGISDGTAGVAEANASDQRQMIAALVMLVLMLAAVVAYLVWVNAANHALRAMGVQGLKFTPAFAVGSHFIPFYNIYAIYAVMEENWKASHAPNEENGGAWQARKLPAIVQAWVALWFIGGVLQRISMGMARKDATIDDLKTSAMVSIVAGLVALISVYLHRKVVTDLNEGLVRKIGAFRQQSRPQVAPVGPA